MKKLVFVCEKKRENNSEKFKSVEEEEEEERLFHISFPEVTVWDSGEFFSFEGREIAAHMQRFPNCEEKKFFSEVSKQERKKGEIKEEERPRVVIASPHTKPFPAKKKTEKPLRSSKFGRTPHSLSRLYTAQVGKKWKLFFLQKEHSGNGKSSKFRKQEYFFEGVEGGRGSFGKKKLSLEGIWH